jgi:hypothetical protein
MKEDWLKKQLTKIAEEEICTCLRSGRTDVETVAQRVEARAPVMFAALGAALVDAEVRKIVRRASQEQDG